MKKLTAGRTAAYYLSYIVIGFATGIIGPTLPALGLHTGTKLGEVSLLFPMVSVGYVCGALFGGRLIDRIKGHPVTAVSLFLMFIVMLFIPAARTLGLLLLLFFLSGIASGSIDVGGNAHIIWVHGEKSPPFMVGLHFFYGLGALLAPLIVARTLNLTGGVEWAYRSLAILSIPALLLLLFLPSPRQHEGGEAEKGTKAGTSLIILLTLFMFLHVGVELCFGGWIYSYALQRNISDSRTAAWLTSAYWAAVTVGRLISAGAAVRVKPLTMLILDLIGASAALVVLLIFPASKPAIWTGSILLGLFLASLIPATFSYAGIHIDISGSIAAWLVIGIGAGNLFFPWFVGQFFETAGPFILPFSNLLTLGAAGLVLYFLVLGMGRITDKNS